VAPVPKEPHIRLEKKPSKKLVIKANDRLPESGRSSLQEKKITDHIAESESVVIKN
jgi:ethanolamine utilization cobalamin adenosyltransferase